MKSYPLMLAVMAAPLAVSTAMAAEAPSEVFELGSIEITAKSESAQPTFVTRVDKEDWQAYQAQDVAEALRREPGVTLTSGGRRAESQLYIRGFDARQITLNVDGIPVYVPYDGNVDLSRFLADGFEQMVVTKGLGSLMYGPNNMGGTINLITKRPDKDFSGSVSVGGEFAGELYNHTESLSAGGWFNDKFYAAGGVLSRNVDTFPLSDDFVPTPEQPAGDRVHANSRDLNANLKLGFVPNATDEYTLSYYRVDAEKGAPPYTGKVPGNLVWWDWPKWDKESLYYIGTTKLGEGYVKTRAYYDSFKNSLSAYDDASLSTQKKNSSFNSTYDDYSWGGNIEGGLPLGDHLLKGLLAYKLDVHQETDLAKQGKPFDSPWLKYESNTASAGIEDVWTLAKGTELSLGYRYDSFEVTQAEEYADNAKTKIKPMSTGGREGADNLLLTLGHDFEGQRVYAGAALKTRFPTLKELYSYRLGRAIPNPDLGAEQVTHFELGARGKLGMVNYNAALFYATLQDAIESVSITPSLTQMQNVGDATNQGVEISLDLALAEDWLLSGNYTYLDRSLGNAALVPTNTPKNQLYATLAWFPLALAELDADVEYASSRQSSTDGLRPVDGYTLFNLRASYVWDKQLTLRAGVFNLADKNYAVTEGDPMPGRTFRVSASYAF